MNEILRAAASVDTRVALVVYLAMMDAWAIWMLAGSDGTRREKTVWSAIIVLCPIIGCLLWYNLGPRRRPGRRRAPPAAPR